VSGSVSAPGKIFLAGEYAVLQGGAAVVAAVDRRATARLVTGGTPASPLVEEVCRAVGAELGPAAPDGVPEIDTTAMSGPGGKLGIGSSAAAAAGAVGAFFDAAGLNLEAEEVRARAFALAERAHRAAQGGRGSGADVAAAVFGGVIRYHRGTDGYGRIEVRPLGPVPAELVVFSTGTPSPTVDHIRAVERLGARDPAEHQARLEAIRVAAELFCAAHQAGRTADLVAAAASAGEALAALGRSADIPIVTPALAAAAAVARDLGGAAKPSGAGGGDVGVGFFPDRRAAEAFRAHAPTIGVEILSITTAVRGLSRDGQPGREET